MLIFVDPLNDAHPDIDHELDHGHDHELDHEHDRELDDEDDIQERR